jgi:hypothetical protein
MAAAATTRQDGMVIDLVPMVVRGPHIVAYVLSDGTVQEPGHDFHPADPGFQFESGTIAGDDWILWWDRRRVR